MDTNKIKTLYESPEAEILETLQLGVICTSGVSGNLDDMDQEGGSWI